MIKFTLAALSALCLLTTPVTAEETRMDRLKNSGLIESLEQQGQWEVAFTPNAAFYNCDNCPATLSAMVKVRTVKPETFGLSAVLENRKKFCAELVTKDGRCISATPFELRVGIIKGYRFESERQCATFIHIQFPYREHNGPHELIHTSISLRSDDTLPSDLERTLLTHMLRLTLFY